MPRYGTPAARESAERQAFEEFRKRWNSYFESGAIFLDGSQICGRNPLDGFAGEVSLGRMDDGADGLESLSDYLIANPDPQSWL